jgi:hypothetical protein
MSNQDASVEGSRPEHLVGLEAYECQPHGGTGPQCLREPDPRVEMTCGRLRRPILGVSLVEAKHKRGYWTFPFAQSHP